MGKETGQTSHRLSCAATTALSGVLQQKLAARSNEKQAQRELEAFNASLLSLVERLLRPHFGGKGRTHEINDVDEERLMAAVRRLDVDPCVRLKAMLVLSNVFAERGANSTKAALQIC